MKNVEIPKWLEGLPLAPEFRPTDTEFADPIAYISKIEKEASAFGICKVIPPFPKPSRKYVLHNLNKSLSKCPELGSDLNLVASSKMDIAGDESCDRGVDGGECRAVFTTRQQELGCDKGRRAKEMVGDQLPRYQKQVWQSGEVYTLEQFEAKSKHFAKSQLGTVKEVNPLVIEAMFWKTASEKPIYVEYANDVPGSGFAEPEGLLHYFHRGRRRRRKRNSFDRNNLGSSDSNNNHLGLSKNINSGKDSGSNNTPNLCKETANSLQPVQPHRTAAFSVNKDFDSSIEMQGTAGWKLSNSPWNLQVIARSPGSLTRFMPDDIPGVTSPMVYVGMLFSWFAWHVEDHDLHSLNFLHMGSPKTWYAVPGDYAFNFEEVIRLHAYGGNIDQLTALSLLGEKTTILSPEVIVASGIPCCRLVQNPGEFVVTFPRAYHIGYSHGFNCGEAANFGTPKWLTVAKEAAVRRAAMNYLPMLSHQQLLYLLTMSFISRIPRSLLPGARSSRMRDRHREERELLVKKAFVADILDENNLLTLLLQRNSSYHAVLWDAELLPSSSKESQFCRDASDRTSASTVKPFPENEDNLDDISQLSKCINAVGFDLNDDDLAYDFQIDSGALPCVACGILGFPFMAVMQPSEEASKKLSLEGKTDKAKSNNRNVSHVNEAAISVAESGPFICSSMEQSLGPELSSPLEIEAASTVEITKRWNISNAFSKPRIFCLEHAMEIEELLCLEGGANVLVICHSDFEKIKAHAAVIAEEIASPFQCNEVPLNTASQEDLNLIGAAIDSEEQVNHAGDWTFQLNINLRNCVKVKKSSSSKKVQRLLTLGGLSCDVTPVSVKPCLNWPSRKIRSRRQVKHVLPRKQSSCTKAVEDVETKLEQPVVLNVDNILHYSRRKYKHRSCGGIGGLADTNNFILQDNTDTNHADPDTTAKSTTISTAIRIENGGDGSSGPCASAAEGKSETLHDHWMLLPTGGFFRNYPPPELANSPVTSLPVIVNSESQAAVCSLNEQKGKDNFENSCHDSQAHEVTGSGGSIEEKVLILENSDDLPKAENGICRAIENETLTDKQIINDIVVASKNDIQVAENDLESHCNIQSDGNDMLEECCGRADSSESLNDDLPPRWDEKQEESFADQLVLDSAMLKASCSGEPQDIQADGDNQHQGVSRFTELVNESVSALAEELQAPCKTHDTVESCSDSDNGSLQEKRESDYSNSTMAHSKSNAKTGNKRKREIDLQTEDQSLVGGFIKSPCEGLRSRTRKDANHKNKKKRVDVTVTIKKLRKTTNDSVSCKGKKEIQKGRHKCNLDRCSMSFQTKAELLLHKGNRCPVEGCRKKFNSHKYAIQHQRVHDDDRPLKCPWNGCTMSFKWAWARTEHLRVHTGERPYVCKVKGCGLTFRFVSDFSRHRRKTGHYVCTTS
ncbi:lysine-specific demethylase ELF6-like isoform X2 [Primulina huaijiensis]|uniref:lysine-specific demethylase ELF6-like isoform X2 n=1 Tax=Primulina huaijiensis TaxID=1492673 RepID=UPI003CC76016